MKKIFVLGLIFCGLWSQATAQQEPLFAQYNTNAFLINPAVAGSQGGHSLRLFHRWQWVSFPGAPKTFGITYQGLIKDLHGVGGLIFADQTGPLVRWGGKLSYAFHIPLANRQQRLSLGMAGRLVRNIIRTNAITFIDQNDQAVIDLAGGATMADAEFGIHYYSPKFYASFSAPNLFQTKMDFGTNQQLRNPLGKGYLHYFLQAGYRFDVGAEKKTTIEPSIMVKYVRGAAVQVDGGVMAHFLDKQLSFGVFYRTPSFLSFQCRFIFDRQIPVLISFDMATAKFQQYSVGASEVMMGYDFKSRNDLFSAPAPKPVKEEEPTEK